MATQHVSPQASIHPHHRPPPGHVQTNGHVAYGAPGPQRPPPSAAELFRNSSEQTWLSLGRAFEHLGIHNEAIQAYERVLSHNEVSTDALLAIATVLRAEDKYADAANYLENIIRLSPDHGEAWSMLGHCYLMMDELQKAYQAYQSALYNLHDPKEPKLWYGIGILYDRYGSLEHAEEAFSQVMRMSPDFDKANEIYFRLGIIYKQQNKYNESLECFRWIAHNPPSPLNQTDILFQIGHVHEQQADFEAAKTAYQRVLDRDPNHAKVLQQLGWLYHQESNEYTIQDKAIEFLEKSVASDQNDAQSWYLLGRCYMSQQKFPKAYEAYQQAVYRDGRNPTFWCSIGVLYYQINQYRDALDAYSRAIRLNPNISEVWYDLGTLYQSCNNQTNDAMDAYQRAAELDPNNPHIKSRLALLRSGHSGPPPSGPTGLTSDPHPQTYEPAALNGPPQPSWNLPQSGPSAPQRAGPLPPGPRDWQQRPSDPHPPGQPPPSHMFDPRSDPREAQRPPPPPPPPPPGRPHSPRTEQIRYAERVQNTPTQRPMQMEPSPRMHEPMYRNPQGVPSGPPPPGSGVASHAPAPSQQHRMTNPNFAGQPPQPLPQQQGPPQYGRPPSPSSVMRPVDRARSPPRQYPPPPPPASWGYPPEPRTVPPMNHGFPPEHQRAAEQATRERDNRTPVSNTSSTKRRPEFDERELDYNPKRPANDEMRERLQDPHPRGYRMSPAPPVKPTPEHERPPPLPQYGLPPQHHSGSNSQGPSQVPSPTAARRLEEHKRSAEEMYRPSEAAHHPTSMQNLMHKEREQPPPPPQQQQQLPPINTTNGATRSGPPSHSGTTPRAEDGIPKKEEPEQRSPTDKRDADGDLKMRGEEPAMRKMDVNEDYDEESGDDSSKAKGPIESVKTNGELARGSPNASGPNSASAETPNSAKPEGK